MRARVGQATTAALALAMLWAGDAFADVPPPSGSPWGQGQAALAPLGPNPCPSSAAYWLFIGEPASGATCLASVVSVKKIHTEKPGVKECEMVLAGPVPLKIADWPRGGVQPPQISSLMVAAPTDPQNASGWVSVTLGTVSSTSFTFTYYGPPTSLCGLPPGPPF